MQFKSPKDTLQTRGKPKMEKIFDSKSDMKSEEGSHRSTNSKKTQKWQKTLDSGWAYTGSEYANNKAGGDVQKKTSLNHLTAR